MEQNTAKKATQTTINRQSELIGEYRNALWKLKNKVYNMPENLQSIHKAKQLIISEIELLLAVTASPEMYNDYKQQKLKQDENISVQNKAN